MIIALSSSIIIVLLSIFAGAGAADGTKYGRDGWLLKCTGCVSEESISRPAVGFALTTSYGVSAVKLYDGTTLAVGKINGDLQFRRLMERLAQVPPTKAASISCICHAIFTYYRQTRRKIYLQFGWSTRDSDVLTLASMLTQLKVLTEAQLGYPIKPYITFTALPALPSLPRWLYEDALDVSGLGFNRTMYRHGFYLRASHAAVAGAGLGVCPLSAAESVSNFTAARQSCSMPLTRLMTIEYTENSLAVTYPWMNTIDNLFDGLVGDTILDTGLGTAALFHLPGYPDQHDPSLEISYWNAVRDTLSQLPGKNPTLPIRKLVIHGDAASSANPTYPGFLSVVESVMEDLNRSSHEDVSKSLFRPFQYMAELKGQLEELKAGTATLDPLYLAAHGAAEMLRRRWQDLAVGCGVCAEDAPPPGESKDRPIREFPGNQAILAD